MARETAKNIARKQYCVQFFDAIRPAAPDPVQRNILFKALASEVDGRRFFVLRTHPYCKPRGSKHSEQSYRYAGPKEVGFKLGEGSTTVYVLYAKSRGK